MPTLRQLIYSSIMESYDTATAKVALRPAS